MSKKENVLVLTFWSYKDALIQTYTLPYVRIIRKVLPAQSKLYLQTLEQPFHKLTEQERRMAKASLKGEGIGWLRVPYYRFGLLAMITWAWTLVRLFFFCKFRGITRIHTWCTPAGSIGYILSRLTGIELVLDSYEPHSDAMVESKTWSPDGFANKLLRKLETWQSHHAKIAIGVNYKMEGYAKESYNASFDQYFSKPACVDLHLFSGGEEKDEKLLRELGLEDKLVCVYAGKFGGIYLEDEVFDLFRVAAEFWGERFHVLLLTGHSRQEIERLCEASGFDSGRITSQYVQHADISRYMSLADFALTPIKPIPSKQYSTPVKDGEYWALGLPVMITPNISDDSEIIEEKNIGSIIRSLHERGYRTAIEEMDALLKGEPRKELHDRIRKVAEEHRSFTIAENIYSTIYG